MKECGPAYVHLLIVTKKEEKKKIRLNKGYLSPFLTRSPQRQKTFGFELFGCWVSLSLRASSHFQMKSASEVNQPTAIPEANLVQPNHLMIKPTKVT